MQLNKCRVFAHILNVSCIKDPRAELEEREPSAL